MHVSIVADKSPFADENRQLYLHPETRIAFRLQAEHAGVIKIKWNGEHLATYSFDCRGERIYPQREVLIPLSAFIHCLSNGAGLDFEYIPDDTLCPDSVEREFCGFMLLYAPQEFKVKSFEEPQTILELEGSPRLLVCRIKPMGAIVHNIRSRCVVVGRRLTTAGNGISIPELQRRQALVESQIRVPIVGRHDLNM